VQTLQNDASCRQPKLKAHKKADPGAHGRRVCFYHAAGNALLVACPSVLAPT